MKPKTTLISEAFMLITRVQYKWLRWAVGQAEMWRGSLVGNPDVTELRNFDEAIKSCKETLKALRAELPVAERK
jgi:hypothetical protein